jgi:hypothetical protein
MDQSIKIFREAILTLKKVDPESLAQGSLADIFNAKSDCDILSWLVSMPLQDVNPEILLIWNQTRKTCLEMTPCINSALRARMVQPGSSEAKESLDCIALKYSELKERLFDLARVLDPSSIRLLEICLN